MMDDRNFIHIPTFWSQRLRTIDEVIQARGQSAALRLQLEQDIISVYDEVNTLQLVATEIKKRQNACLSLLRLPTEVLREIISVTAEIWPAAFPHCQSTLRQKSSPTLGWITISHICHALRSIAISHRSLWADVVCLFPKAVREFVSRSGGLPLKIDIVPKRCLHNIALASAVRPYIFQAKSIRIADRSYMFKKEDKVKDADMWPFDASELSSKDFHFLDELEICLDPASKHWRGLTADVFDLPRMSAPRLRSLSLRDCYVPFHPHTLCELELVSRTLKLAAPFSHILNMLALCVNLKTLSLRRWIAPGPTPKLQAPVSMPSLVTLTIEDFTDRCLALYSRLDLPPTASVSLQCIMSPADRFADSYLTIIGRVSGRFKGNVQGLRIAQDTLDGHIMVATTVHSDSAPVEWPRSNGNYDYRTVFSLLFRFNEDPPEFKPAFERMLETVNTTDIGSLEIEESHTDIYTADEWRAMLSSFPRLHTLYHGYAGDHQGLLCALTVDESQLTPLLPSLRTLNLAHLCLLEEPTVGGGHISFRDFFRFLKSRQQADVGLERLFIGTLESNVKEVPNIDETIFLRLSAFVPDVDCHEFLPIE